MELFTLSITFRIDINRAQAAQMSVDVHPPGGGPGLGDGEPEQSGGGGLPRGGPGGGSGSNSGGEDTLRPIPPFEPSGPPPQSSGGRPHAAGEASLALSPEARASLTRALRRVIDPYIVANVLRSPSIAENASAFAERSRRSRAPSRARSRSREPDDRREHRDRHDRSDA